jgi:pilus assembly protein Flp/PilA
MCRHLGADRRAVTAMEYGLIAALVSAIVIGALTTLGTGLAAKLATLAGALS